jgi:hypothetical protein
MKIPVFLLTPFLFLCLICSCSSSGASDRYVHYLDRVLSILNDATIEVPKKGPAILAFVEKNKAEIETTIAALRGLSAKETEGVADKVRTKVSTVIDSIRSISKTSPEIGEDRSLVSALRALKVIGG